MNYNIETANTLVAIDKLIINSKISDISAFEKLLKFLPTDIKNKVIQATNYNPGFLFAGADFASLEDRINAILTNDQNKIKVYTDGFDGHNLRAFSYFTDKMPDVREKINELKINQRFFKITSTSGEIEYVSERELNARGIKIPN